MSDGRLRVVILGRFFGTAEGWDQPIDTTLQFYDFIPAENVPLRAADVFAVLYDAGIMEYYDDAGNTSEQFDIVEFLSTNALDKETSES